MYEKEIQNFIETENSPYASEILLPDSVYDKNVSFYETLDTPTILFIPLGILVAVLVYFLQQTDYQKELTLRKEQLMADYPEIVSKLLLLHGAGLTIKNAFSVILSDAKAANLSDHYIYREIEYTLHKLNTGTPELGAYSELGQRCGLHTYIKLGSLLEQNIKKGSSDLHAALTGEVQEAFMLHKNNILQTGEKASTKMLFPMILLLLIIMIIVIVPAFFSMNT